MGLLRRSVGDSTSWRKWTAARTRARGRGGGGMWPRTPTATASRKVPADAPMSLLRFQRRVESLDHRAASVGRHRPVGGPDRSRWTARRSRSRRAGGGDQGPVLGDPAGGGARAGGHPVAERRHVLLALRAGAVLRSRDPVHRPGRPGRAPGAGGGGAGLAGRRQRVPGPAGYAPAYVDGTRDVVSARIGFSPPGSKPFDLQATLLLPVHLMAGTGYGLEPDWKHGMYEGPDLVVQGVSYDLSRPEDAARMWAWWTRSAGSSMTGTPATACTSTGPSATTSHSGNRAVPLPARNLWAGPWIRVMVGEGSRVWGGLAGMTTGVRR